MLITIFGKWFIELRWGKLVPGGLIYK